MNLKMYSLLGFCLVFCCFFAYSQDAFTDLKADGYNGNVKSVHIIKKTVEKSWHPGAKETTTTFNLIRYYDEYGMLVKVEYYNNENNLTSETKITKIASNKFDYTTTDTNGNKLYSSVKQYSSTNLLFQMINYGANDIATQGFQYKYDEDNHRIEALILYPAKGGYALKQKNVYVWTTVYNTKKDNSDGKKLVTEEIRYTNEGETLWRAEYDAFNEKGDYTGEWIWDYSDNSYTDPTFINVYKIEYDNEGNKIKRTGRSDSSTTKNNKSSFTCDESWEFNYYDKNEVKEKPWYSD